MKRFCFEAVTLMFFLHATGVSYSIQGSAAPNMYLPRMHEQNRQLKIFRDKRSESTTSARHRKSLIKALDSYFGFNKRSALPMEVFPMDTETGRNSGKKELIHGTVEMPMSSSKAMDPMKAMAVVLLPEDEMKHADDEKMMKMVDEMLSKMKPMMADSMMMKSMMEHKSDIVHGFENPAMDEVMKKGELSEGFEDNFLASTLQNSSTKDSGSNTAEVEGNSTDVSSASGHVNSQQPAELQFTTLEVDLGPAILPLEVPEGYFVPFIPRQAFGVTNGVARPPHGHASFYSHRPAGLVDVKNSPAFGFLFSGHTRTPDIS